jgi:ABC-type nitrate/sulfonate/bicarbonate transport system ATPase subunit
MQATPEAPVKEPHPFSIDAGPALAVNARGLGFGYGELVVLRDLDLSLRPGEVVGVVGPSGCGKSTLLELVSGLREPDGGKIEVGGEAAAQARLAHCAYMPQRDLLLPWLSAIDNAALALRNRGLGRGAARDAAAPLLEHFGLEGFESSRPSQLSGGMRQRVAFARTVLAGKPVLLLDEPFAGLDAITRAEMQEWLAGALAAGSGSTLLVTHDVEEALYLCDRVVVLSARPAQAVAELASPAPRAASRSAAVTSLEFVRARERALEALKGGSG